jgi:two-component system nitrogen regulation response regulator GlnG
VLLPLREHPEDIGELLWKFIRKNLISQDRGHLLPENCTELAGIAAWADLFHRFVMYSWPGNIRELENFSRQVGLASESLLTVPEALRVRLYLPTEGEGKPEDIPVDKLDTKRCQNCSGEDFLAGYEKARFQVARTAKQLGISRQAAYRHISDLPDLCLARELPPEKVSLAMEKNRGDLTAAAAQLKVSRTALREYIRHSATNRAP